MGTLWVSGKAPNAARVASQLQLDAGRAGGAKARAEVQSSASLNVSGGSPTFSHQHSLLSQPSRGLQSITGAAKGDVGHGLRLHVQVSTVHPCPTLELTRAAHPLHAGRPELTSRCGLAAGGSGAARPALWRRASRRCARSAGASDGEELSGSKPWAEDGARVSRATRRRLASSDPSGAVGRAGGSWRKPPPQITVAPRFTRSLLAKEWPWPNVGLTCTD